MLKLFAVFDRHDCHPSCFDLTFEADLDSIKPSSDPSSAARFRLEALGQHSAWSVVGHNGAVPKITADTVAEHRLAKRRALIASAKGIISDLGMKAVTPRSVCEQAGLARSTFYIYFPSKDDLLAAVAAQAFEEWATELETAMADAAPGLPRLHAYVDATIRMTSDGKHSLATSLRQADLAPKSFEAIMAMHDTLTAPLFAVLHELGVSDSSVQATLVQGVINASMQLVGHGMNSADVTQAVTTFLDRGLHD